MQLEVTHENLHKALAMASRIVGLRSTLPILNNVLLATEKGRLKVTATDLEVGITTWIGAKIEKEGSFTVPAKLFGDFIASLTDKTVKVSTNDGSLKVETLQSTANLKGLPADEFPLIPEPKQQPVFSLAPLLLKEALRKTVVAAAVDETRPALSGVLLWKLGKTLRTTATDSYRLAETTLELTGKVENAETKLIIPQRVAQELVRLLEGGDETVSLMVSENQALFRTESFLLVSRLIEGDFPNYTDIIPKSGPIKVEVATEDLIRAVKVAALFAREVGNHITLTTLPHKGLSVRAASPQLGENEATLDADVSGEELAVSFNARFLQDAVAAISSKTTHLTFTGKTSPAVFREEGNKDFLHLVMPLRLDT